MKKIFSILVLFNIVCFAVYAQVGLLSSNNKSDNNNQNTKSLPTLSFTKELGNYEKLSDSFQIKLHFDTALSASFHNINNLSVFSSEYDTKKSMINQLDANTERLNDKINEIKRKIDPKKNKPTAATLIKSNEEITRLTDSITRNQKEKDQLQKELNDKTAQLDSSFNLNKEIINELTTINYKTFHDALAKLETINKTRSGDLYSNKYKTNSYWFLIDSSKEEVDKTKFLDSLTLVYKQISLESDDNADVKKSIRDEIQKLEDFKINIDTATISSPNQYTKEIKNKWMAFASDTQRLSKAQKAVDDSSLSTIIFYKDIVNNNIKNKTPPKKDVETKEFGAFPQLTSILGKKEVIPTLQLYGSYSQQNITQSFEANLGISFAPTNTPDTSNIYTIFIPTASKFLVHSNFTWSFLPVGTKTTDTLAKKVGLRLDVSFASKNLLYDTTKSSKTITSSFLYAKAGIELGVIPKRLSIYSNINTATVLDQVDEFQSGTSVHSKFLGYIDCGARLYFDPTPTAKVGDGLFIYSNLNFIINSGDVKRVTKSNDTVIPSIQVGLVKSLGKF